MRAEVETYLATLAGRETATALLEVRWRDRERFRRRFFPIGELAAAAAFIRATGRRTDIYVGVAPRTREHGGLGAIDRVWVLWADVDGSLARLALADFEPTPSMVVRSGSGVNVHAYWALTAALASRHAARANRRLAAALGADMVSTDAARILRPPALNFKHGDPRPVYIEAFTGQLYPARDVVGHLPDPVEEAPAPLRRSRPPARTVGDPLLSIPSSEYVPRLTGRQPRRDGKVQCPFHGGGQERGPSLHTWDDPARGWFCYGSCRRGGSIYDFGALLWDLGTRGDDFRRLRARLLAELGIAPARAAA